MHVPSIRNENNSTLVATGTRETFALDSESIVVTNWRQEICQYEGAKAKVMEVVEATAKSCGKHIKNFTNGS